MLYFHLMKYLLSIAFLVCLASANAQQKSSPKGKLFIIGGGDRSTELMQTLVKISGISAKDYVVVLPMSSEEPDSSYLYFKADLQPVCSSPIVNFNFTKENSGDKSWLDSLEKARLIFITGGDQVRFMNIALNSPIQTAISKAFANGCTIAGTSAGAAVMSKYMITGNELTEKKYNPTFKKIRFNNIEIKEGLGLTNAIIDQHFVVRSRYNRLFSALARYPNSFCIGIDEATAIIITGNRVKITGESQVMVLSNPLQLKIDSAGRIKWQDIAFSVYTAGDEFVMANKIINRPSSKD